MVGPGFVPVSLVAVLVVQLLDFAVVVLVSVVAFSSAALTVVVVLALVPHNQLLHWP